MSPNQLCTCADQRVKGFPSMKENIVRMHLFIPGLLPSVPTELSARPAPLHFDALPLAEADCSGECVPLRSEHSPRCLGNDTLKKHLHGNAIKSAFCWVVQAVSRDDSRKCSVKATWCGMDGGWGIKVGRRMPPKPSIRDTQLPSVFPALCVLIPLFLSDEACSHALFIAAAFSARQEDM